MSLALFDLIENYYMYKDLIVKFCNKQG